MSQNERKKRIQLRKLKNNYEHLKEDKRVLENKMREIRNEISNIEKSLESEGGDITLSEHALVRYMERVKKIDLDKIREEVLTERTIGTIKAMGDGKYPIGDYTITVKNNTIITIY